MALQIRLFRRTRTQKWLISAILITANHPQLFKFSIAVVVSFVFFVFALAFAGFYVWHLWRIWLERRRYTRERFLFGAFRAIVAASLTCFSYLLGGASTVHYLFGLVSGAGIDFPVIPSGPDAVSVIGATVVLLALLLFTYFAFRNWDGPLSEFERRNSERPIIELILVQLTDLEQRRLMLRPGQEPAPTTPATAPPAPPGHLRAMTLIMAHDPQYQLRAEDWHAEEHAFLGNYGSEAQPFVFFYEEHLNSSSAQFIRDRAARNYVEHRKRIIAESVDPTGQTELPSDLEVLTFDAILDDRARDFALTSAHWKSV